MNKFLMAIGGLILIGGALFLSTTNAKAVTVPVAIPVATSEINYCDWEIEFPPYPICPNEQTANIDCMINCYLAYEGFCITLKQYACDERKRLEDEFVEASNKAYEDLQSCIGNCVPDPICIEGCISAYSDTGVFISNRYNTGKADLESYFVTTKSNYFLNCVNCLHNCCEDN